MFKLIRKDKKKGFTLVELIVVIAILAILALILVPAITGYVSRANTAKDEANAKALYNQAMLIAADKDPDAGSYTHTAEPFDELDVPTGGSVSIIVEDGVITSFEYAPKAGATPIPVP